jgi:exodeoxyribonuclease (lambda-induced)
MYEIETGNTVTEVGYCQLDDYSGCSPDGFIGEDGLIEIKCPCDSVFVRYLYDKKVDPKYYAQMQMQMLVTGRKWCDYVVFNQNFEKSIVIKRIELDEESQVKLNFGLEQGKTKIKEIVKNI